uniref:CSON009194 protein n=1 Tax=Culicoides sonorensis TaxID=179676 RepID=A0A336LZT4_CULSO
MKNWNFSILLLVYVTQCIASIDDPVADSGIFMEDVCRDIENNVKLNNPFDKRSFFECIDGESIERVCPGKRSFDARQQKCVQDPKSRLTTRPRPSPRIGVRPHSRENAKLIASRLRVKPKPLNSYLKDPVIEKKLSRFVREIHSSEEGELTMCKDQKNWIMLPNEEDCQKYYLCINEVTYPRECPDGDWFDQRRQGCVPQRESSCTREAPEGYCENVPNFQKLESPYYCEDYYMCVNDIAYYYRCDNNQWFDQKNQRCDKPENVDCLVFNPPNPPEDICVGVSNFKYVPSPYNCAHYYQCVFERPYFKKCAEGKWFDQEKQTCRDKQEVECNII